MRRYSGAEIHVYDDTGENVVEVILVQGPSVFGI